MGGCPRSLAFGDLGSHAPALPLLTHHKCGCPTLATSLFLWLGRVGTTLNPNPTHQISHFRHLSLILVTIPSCFGRPADNFL
jgi:hypothetical protein